MRASRVVVLGEKPQGAVWLTYLLDSKLFDVVAGVPRFGSKNVWWDGECFAAILRGHDIPVVRRRDLHQIDYDVIWSLMYGFVIEGELIDRADVGLNLHESPLPRHRGCNGYSHAILDGEETYGTSFHVLDAELDNGDLIDQEIFGIDPDETAKELYVRTTFVSNRLFERNLSRVAEGNIETTPLDTGGHPIRPRSSLMDLKHIPKGELKDLSKVYRRARAFDFVPFEPCYFYRAETKFYVFLNNSLGRFDHRGEGFTKSGQPRDVVVMESSVYRNHYPIFEPRYSWT